jgi:hypothetical protein
MMPVADVLLLRGGAGEPVRMQPHEARVNVTYNGTNFELPDPVHYQAGDGDIKAWVTEAIRTGSVPGVAADPAVNLANFMVDRFDAPAAPVAGQRDHNLIQVRPKTAYGRKLFALIMERVFG